MTDERIAELSRYVPGGMQSRDVLRAAINEALEEAANSCEGIFSGAAGNSDYNAGLVDAAARIQKAIRALKIGSST